MPISSGCNQDIVLTDLVGSCSALFGAGNKTWLGTFDGTARLPLHAGEWGAASSRQAVPGFAQLAPGYPPEWRLQPLWAGKYH